MSVSAIDGSSENHTSHMSNRSGQKPSTGSDIFASMMQGKLPATIAFHRIERDIALPQGAQQRADSQPVERPRKDAAQDRAGKARPRDDGGPRRSADSGRGDRTAQESSTRDSRPVGRENSRGDETAAAGPTQAERGHDRQVSPNAAAQARTEAAAAPSANGSDANAAAARGQGVDLARLGSNAGRNAADENIAPRLDPALAQGEAGKNADPKNGGVLKATVTRASDQALAQPATSVAASAVTTAQTHKSDRSRGIPFTEGRPPGLAAMLDSDPESAAGARGQVGQAVRQGVGEPQGGQPANGQTAGDLAKLGMAQQGFDQLAASAQNAAAKGSSGAAAGGQAAQPIMIDGGSSSAALSGQHGQVQHKPGSPQTQSSARPNFQQQIVANQVAVNIQRAVNQGLDRISIQLRPPELGRIDVRMDVARDGKVTAVISVERQDTLDMLRQDSRTLTQALQDAGLKADQNSLSFNLKGQNDQSEDGRSLAGGAGRGDSDAEGAGERVADADDGLLGVGEAVQADEDGHYDVRV